MDATPIVHDTRTEAEKRYDAERDGSLYHAPAVLVRPHICDDELDDEQFGTHIWTDYTIGDVDVTISTPAHERDYTPMVYIGSAAEMPWATLLTYLPALNALAADPTLATAVRAWERRQP